MKTVNLDYANGSRSVWEHVEITGSSFVSASLSEVKLKKIKMKDNRFESTDFFQTILKGMDFSECEWEAFCCQIPGRKWKGRNSAHGRQSSWQSAWESWLFKTQREERKTAQVNLCCFHKNSLLGAVRTN